MTYHKTKKNLISVISTGALRAKTGETTGISVINNLLLENWKIKLRKKQRNNMYSKALADVKICDCLSTEILIGNCLNNSAAWHIHK